MLVVPMSILLSLLNSLHRAGWCETEVSEETDDMDCDEVELGDRRDVTLGQA